MISFSLNSSQTSEFLAKSHRTVYDTIRGRYSSRYYLPGTGNILAIRRSIPADTCNLRSYDRMESFLVTDRKVILFPVLSYR